MLKIHWGLSLSVKMSSLGFDFSQNRFNYKTVLPFRWPKWARVCNPSFSAVWVLVLSKIQFCMNFSQENCTNTFFTGNVSHDHYLSFSTLAATVLLIPYSKVWSSAFQLEAYRFFPLIQTQPPVYQVFYLLIVYSHQLNHRSSLHKHFHEQKLPLLHWKALEGSYHYSRKIPFTVALPQDSDLDSRTLLETKHNAP